MTEPRPELPGLDGQGPSPAAPPGVFETVLDAVTGPPSLKARLSELPTSTRLAVAGAAVLVLTLAVVLLRGARGDLPLLLGFPTPAALLVLVAILALSIHTSLRAVVRPPLGVLARPLLVLLPAAPLALALLPLTWPGSPDPMPPALQTTCLWWGLGAGLLLGLGLRLFCRGGGLLRPLTAGAAGGLLAFLVLTLTCASSDPDHLRFAHGVQGLVVAAALVASWLAAGWSERP